MSPEDERELRLIESERITIATNWQKPSTTSRERSLLLERLLTLQERERELRSDPE